MTTRRENTTRLLIQLPADLKAKLDALRKQGYTAAGFIRSLLERELSQAPALGRKIRRVRHETTR